MRSTTKRGPLTYTNYNFIDKDPVLDAFKTVLQESGLTYKEVHEKGGPVPATLRKWDIGNTRSSRFDTLKAAFLACGSDLVAISPKTGKTIKITPKKK